MTIEEIYKSADNIILTHLMINDEAMKYTQSMGYNGFKRMHRCLVKKLLKKHLMLSTCYFDRYNKILDVRVDKPSYSPMSLKGHFEKWKELLERHIQELGELNQEHFDLVGCSNEIIECVMHKFVRKLEKVNRWILRFNESNWNPIELHNVDDYIHKKYKKKEEEEGE